MVFVECFFDESGCDARANNLCVSGYIIERDQYGLLCREWQDVLEAYGLSHFHMTDCAHYSEEFKEKLSRAQCIDVARSMIEIIKRRVIMGLTASIQKDDYRFLMPPDLRHENPYVLAIRHVLSGVRHWIEHVDLKGKVSCFFEAGHESQSFADRVMSEIFDDPVLSRRHRYAGHEFVPKRVSPGAQAADLLAWQFHTDLRHKIEGKPRRLDYTSLLDAPHRAHHFGRKEMLELGLARGFYPDNLPREVVERILNLPAQGGPNLPWPGPRVATK